MGRARRLASGPVIAPTSSSVALVWSSRLDRTPGSSRFWYIHHAAIDSSLHMEHSIVEVANLESHEFAGPHAFAHRQPKDEPLSNVECHLRAPQVLHCYGALSERLPSVVAEVAVRYAGGQYQMVLTDHRSVGLFAGTPRIGEPIWTGVRTEIAT
jgi:hypothetical protein